MGAKSPNFVRQSVAFKAEEMALLLKLKHHLEAEANEPLSVAEVIRRGLECLAKERHVS